MNNIFEYQSAGDFFQHHTVLILVGWLLFPRIMFWFISAITGGFLFWVGVFCCPYLMAAWWATIYYWQTNPDICIGAWIMVLLGSYMENIKIIKYE